jgi:hypothetical protein
VNGGRMLDTMLSLDGIQVNAYVSGMGGGPTQPSLEAVQEVNVDLAGTSAEFARAADVTVITKSGTNSFHGNAYYDYNGNDLNARNFFSPTVPFRVYNNFAGAFGGPIKKDKTFFFVTYDGSREAATTAVTGNVPLPAWRTGDFAGLAPITDPTTGQPFPGNIIPASRISPVSTAVQKFFFPMPNFGAPSQQANNWTGNLFANTGYTHYDTWSGRIDEILSAKDTFFARYNYRKSLRAIEAWPEGSGLEIRPKQGAVASWTHIFSPTVFNELRAGFVRNWDGTQPDEIGSTLLSQFGITGIPYTGVPNPPGFVISGVASTNIGTSSAIGGNNDNLGIDTDIEYTDNVGVTRGKHLMKFGADWIHDAVSGYSEPSSIYGTYNFTGTYTGLGYADFLLGIPQTTVVAALIPEVYHHGNTYSAYAQDEYKISPRLTLNFGIRYEIQTPYTDARDDLFSYDPAKKAIVVPNAGINNINPYYPKNLPIINATEAGYPAGSLFHTHYHDSYPRVGFAYKPFSNDKTVLRGGYGIYGDNVFAALALNDMVGGPFSGSETFTNKITNGVPLFSFPSPFLSQGTTATQNISGLNPNIYVPYTEQFTLTLEHQLGLVGLRMGYVGTRSTGLIYERNIDQPEPSTIPYTSSRAYTDPLYNAIDYYDNGGTQQYNGLQILAVGRLGKNITFNNGFTWAKDLTDTQATSLATGTLIQNQFCRRCERGVNPATRALRGYINAVWALPFGRGQRFLGNANRFVDGILGGWSTSWISEMQSGQYFNPSYTGFYSSNTNTIGGRPNVIGNPYANVPAGRMFNPAAFAVPGCPVSNPVCTNPADVGEFGNAGVSTLIGPTIINWDVALAKSFVVRERYTIRLRILSTDAFNHANFANPSGNISVPSTVALSSSTFGEQIGETARQVHVSLRVQF